MTFEDRLLALNLVGILFVTFFHVIFFRAAIALFNRLFAEKEASPAKVNADKQKNPNAPIGEPSFFATYLFLAGVSMVFVIFWRVVGPNAVFNLGIDPNNAMFNWKIVLLMLFTNTFLLAIMVTHFLDTTYPKALLICVFQSLIGGATVGGLIAFYLVTNPS
ncbi:hypothetical protein ACYFX5_09480 [Bremerella sp. T1]|uniref:hypothetical protein n=1 Tax=Bremerella sp. TYQ1 TaxID=3119568 RepID=UPI001CCBB281|nr:hypothetical protein [Bremerella volcania]UBM38484.1 hypothetical protein LA756_11420 [Bremerella volcania]